MGELLARLLPIWPCPKCGGTRIIDGEWRYGLGGPECPEVRCPACGGRGWVYPVTIETPLSDDFVRVAAVLNIPENLLASEFGDKLIEGIRGMVSHAREHKDDA